MSAKEARDHFSDILGRAYYRGEPTIVEKQGKPMAVVISPAQYEQFQQQQKLAKDRFFEIVDQIQERNKDKDPDEVYRDVTEAVEEVRQGNYMDNKDKPFRTVQDLPGAVAATEGIIKGQQPAKTAEELREAAEIAIADEAEERSSN